MDELKGDDNLGPPISIPTIAGIQEFIRFASYYYPKELVKSVVLQVLEEGEEK